ncbi:MAG: TSUP family transporter [Pikeienuella sp.]
MSDAFGIADVFDGGLMGFALIASAVFFGAIIQRLTGQAFGMIAAPVVALLSPELLPAVLLLLGVLLGAGAASLDASAVNWQEARYGCAGRALGAIVGAVLAAKLTDPRSFSVIVGVIVLTAVALSASGLRAPINRLTLPLAGLAAGMMGTITAIGAPPMALLYGGEEARRSRAMQNLFFGWGMVWSIGALAVAGLVRIEHLIAAAMLVPIVGAALLAAAPVARLMDGRSVRPMALTLAAAAALTLLWRAWS